MYSFKQGGVLTEWGDAGLIEFDWNTIGYIYTEKGLKSIQPADSSSPLDPANPLDPFYQAEAEAERRLKVAIPAIPALYIACETALSLLSNIKDAGCSLPNHAALEKLFRDALKEARGEDE
ncbi:MAG TPA: hypothetical protein VH186_37060 [Chloroflexia bacterium]|nr:hypothetical protein [Chloroflexia bacterium]